MKWVRIKLGHQSNLLALLSYIECLQARNSLCTFEEWMNISSIDFEIFYAYHVLYPQDIPACHRDVPFFKYLPVIAIEIKIK